MNPLRSSVAGAAIAALLGSTLVLRAHADPPVHAPSASAPVASSGSAPVAPSASAAPRSIPWEKIGDDDGIAVYRREIPGSPVIAFKGDGVVNASILRVASVLVDSSRATEWVDSVVEAKTLRHVSE